MDKKNMIRIFMDTQEELKARLEKILIDKYGKQNVINEDGFLYAKGTHPVLLVAHLDTVHKKPPRDIYVNLSQTRMLASEGIGGDDRCGVIIILDIIEKYKCSVVFCEDEEIGGVGATKFGDMDYNIDVNYAVEFDRKGNNDYVFYKDANGDFEEHIKKFGFKEANGSFSDISSIAVDYKIEAVNISSGYYNPHTTNEYVDFEDMEDITKRAMLMIGTPTEKFEYVEDLPFGQTSFTNSYYYDNSDWYYCGSGKKKTTYTPPTNYPIKLYKGQTTLKINGKPTKFDSLVIDSSNNISDIIYKKKKVKTRATDDVTIWANTSQYQASYWSYKYRYEDQIQKPKEEKKSTAKVCYFCGEEIDKDDTKGLEVSLCKNCRTQYYDDDYFDDGYYYE